MPYFISDSPFQKLGSRDEGDYGRKIEKMREKRSREEKERDSPFQNRYTY
jgi:hypothetical protein